MAKISYGPNVSNIRGKVGNNVFSDSRTGPTLRIAAGVRNPRTNAQIGVRSNLARAAVAFRGLTTAQTAAWITYAQGITRTHPVSGRTYTPATVTVFTGLGAKFLQVNPSGNIPLIPPTSTYSGDSVLVTATAAAGQITFTASAANSANPRTELLLQPLRSRNRQPTKRGYRTKAFAAFAAGALTQNIAVTPGIYAPAYRFVNAQTGQQTTLVPLPVIQVV